MEKFLIKAINTTDSSRIRLFNNYKLRGVGHNQYTHKINAIAKLFYNLYVTDSPQFRILFCILQEVYTHSHYHTIYHQYNLPTNKYSKYNAYII